MAVYEVIDHLRGGPDRARTWIIERRVVRGNAPIRLRFNGTLQDARKEADRLNALLRTQRLAMAGADGR